MKYTLLLPALACLLFGGLLKAAPAGAGSEAQNKDALLATAAVFELLESKCNDCHGAHLTKPKGKFGYTMDLKRVAANDEYIVPGDPDKSELFRLVNEDEMPGKDSEHGVATAAEKLALKQWIQIGAPSALPEARRRTPHRPAPPSRPGSRASSRPCGSRGARASRWSSGGW
jgi:mono/diheme cytochrome c family protein